MLQIRIFKLRDYSQSSFSCPCLHLKLFIIFNSHSVRNLCILLLEAHDDLLVPVQECIFSCFPSQDKSHIRKAKDEARHQDKDESAEELLKHCLELRCLRRILISINHPSMMLVQKLLNISSFHTVTCGKKQSHFIQSHMKKKKNPFLQFYTLIFFKQTIFPYFFWYRIENIESPQSCLSAPDNILISTAKNQGQKEGSELH